MTSVIGNTWSTARSSTTLRAWVVFLGAVQFGFGLGYLATELLGVLDTVVLVALAALYTYHLLLVLPTSQ